MRFVVALLINIFLVHFAEAEVISFSLSRDGVGYQQVEKPQLLSLLPGDTLFITTESGKEFTVDVERFSRSFHGNLLVGGETFSGGQFVLVVNPTGEIYGSLRDDYDFYRLSTSAGQSRIMLGDVADTPLPYDEDGLTVTEPDVVVLGYETSDESSAEFTTEETIYPTFSNETAEIDLLLYYDTNLENHKMVLDYIVELGNQVLADTLTDTVLNVVASKPVDIPVDVSNSEVLEFMSEDLDIANDRSFYKADLVHAIRATTSNTYDDGVCGVAYFTVSNGLGKRDDAWSQGVTQWKPRENYSYYCPDETFIHEVGHNLGSTHERGQYDGGIQAGTAYPYSYGVRETGSFRTIMSYGTEPYVGIFSAPEGTCAGIACGIPITSPNSADNRRSILNTRHIVGGFEGEEFKYESIQEWATVDGSWTCTSTGEALHGLLIKNSHKKSVSLRSVTWLRADGSIYSKTTWDEGERVVEQGKISGWGWCHTTANPSPIGADVREAFFVYANPNTGALVEGQHILFDDNYSGTYSTIRAAASDGGSVEGHPSFTVRDDQDTTISFKPRAGYVLSGVTGTCKGRIQGNDFIVENDYGDCTVIAQFSPQQSTDDVFRVSLEEPGAGSTYSGIKNLRGWALASTGIDRIEIYIDGVYQFDSPYGGPRPDVGNIFPEIERASESGFSSAFNYNELTAGKHTVTAKAISSSGGAKASSVEFTVTKFHKPFFQPNDLVDLSGSACYSERDSISIVDAIVDGKTYDIELQWRTAAQDFEIIEIR